MNGDIRGRKQKHLDICLNHESPIESGGTGLKDIRLPHSALHSAPPSGLEHDFLGSTLSMPLLISCMTGGSEEGRRLNILLAECAGDLGLAIGTGSIRVMLDHPETRGHFEFKKYAGNIPVLANIGAAQVANGRHRKISDAADSIDADAVCIHLNPAQEFFQDGGDRNFASWRDSVGEFIETSPVPVLVKETGAGIPPVDGLELLSMGASHIDIAGAGGTDWVAVENLSSGDEDSSFRDWGYPTAELLLAYRQIVRAGGESGRLVENRVIASGGLRRPIDYARALACGADMTASALPFIRIASEGGVDAVRRYVESIRSGITAAIALTGAASLEKFRQTEIMVPDELADRAEYLAESALASGNGNT